MLVMLGMVGPFAMQVFLPSLPGLVDEFSTSQAAVQLTISLYVGAFAFAQLGYGPLSDRFGRRRVILVGLVIYIIAPVICATAENIETLAVGRALQAIGGCVGLMFARVIARDLFERNRAAGIIGLVTMATSLIGSATPMLGGWIDVSVGWRYSFWVSSAFGIVVFFITLIWLPETRPKDIITDSIIGTLTKGFQLLRYPVFVGYVGHGTCTLSAWYSMLVGLPFVLVDALGQPPTAYGIYFPMLSLGYMAGNLITSRVASKWGIHRLIYSGAGLSIVACPILIIWCIVLEPSPLSLFLPMGLIALGHGLSQPGATSGAIGVDPGRAGSAAGFMGFGQWLAAAIAAQVTGMVQNGTIWPTIIIVVGFTVLSGFFYLLALWGEHRSLDRKF